MSGPGEFDLILRDRPYHDAVLDLDRSTGDVPEGIINQYRFIRICGKLLEQSYCCPFTSDAVFVATNV